MSTKAPAAGAPGPAQSRQAVPRGRRQTRPSDRRDLIDEAAVREHELERDAWAERLRRMRPEERQAAECQERAFDEAVRGEEQERQKELERLGLSHLQGKLFRILTELAELTWREVVAMLYSVKWDTLGPIQRRRYRGKLRALLFRLNRQLEAEGRKRRGLPVDDSRRRRPLPPRPAGAKTRVQREREALLSCTSAIRGALAGGPLPAWRLKQLCRERGYKPGTVKKARKRLGVTAIREGFGESMLYLPPD